MILFAGFLYSQDLVLEQFSVYYFKDYLEGVLFVVFPCYHSVHLSLCVRLHLASKHNIIIKYYINRSNDVSGLKYNTLILMWP